MCASQINLDLCAGKAKWGGVRIYGSSWWEWVLMLAVGFALDTHHGLGQVADPL